MNTDMKKIFNIQYSIFNSKALWIFIISAMICFQTGCDSYFDQQPQGEWVEGENPGGSFESDVFTLYALVRGYSVSSGIPAFAIHSFRSEDADKGSTLSDGSEQATMYDQFNYDASNGLIQSYWTDTYAIIRLANSLIADIQDYQDAGNELSSGDLINWSEAHFFRAYCYFNLVRAFGEVPKIDFRVTDASQANVPKSSVASIYLLVDADLAEAEKNLPPSWDISFIGRLTYGAARSLHAKAYLTRNDWSNTFTAATDVINSGTYNLNTPYSKIFRESGENSSESILEWQCTATPSQPADLKIGSQWCEVQGVRGAGNWDLGWGWNTPTQALADAFETGDPRKDETLLYFGKTGEDTTKIKSNTPWGEKPVANADVINPYYSKKAYCDPSLRKIYTKHGFWYNIRMIRFADVVLMAAEAANEQGNSTDALTYLEMVRARARGTATDILPKVIVTDQALLRDAIRHERRVELGMEFDRFYDLVRWDLARQTLPGYLDKNAYLPLPQSEVDKSNGVLVQNPNY